MTDPIISGYQKKIVSVIENIDSDSVNKLCFELKKVWKNGNQVFICGNGGSAANAIHFTNDLIYGISKDCGKGIKAHALPANQSIVTCYANDLSYEEIFSKQLDVLGNQGDVLIVLSGSGNSDNIIRAIVRAKEIGMKTYGLLGYSGGRALGLLDCAIHIKVDDMEVSEDCQLVILHMVKMWLINNMNTGENQ